MKHVISIFILCALAFTACTQKPSKAELRRAEKHQQDSISLTEQQRSLTFYQSQLEELMPVADSLLPMFKYEKNEKYEDHGFYVATGYNGLRVKVRDDGNSMLMYRNGKRVDDRETCLKGASKQEKEIVDRAEHLQIVMSDIKELEKRIARTSLEIQKYEKRLQK